MPNSTDEKEERHLVLPHRPFAPPACAVRCVNAWCYLRRVARRQYVRVALHLPGGQGYTLRGGALSREHHASFGLPAVGPVCSTAQHEPAFQGRATNIVVGMYSVALEAASATEAAA